ncbi:MAG: cytochrome c [Pseudorhodobacter sp.]|nr:cytochrome c [Pseudorhodobacter sp.]
MTRKMRMSMLALVAVSVAMALYWSGLWPATRQAGEARPMVAVVVPALEGDAISGARVFADKCASCHGDNATGLEGLAPPLIHKFYVPSHHGDAAFYRAAELGVRAHHWRFGNMPPVEGITRAEVGTIIAYVRALQQANGMF